MTKITLQCKTCGAKARRPLMDLSGCRGVYETPPELALCPNGHGEMQRIDHGQPRIKFT